MVEHHHWKLWKLSEIKSKKKNGNENLETFYEKKKTIERFSRAGRSVLFAVENYIKSNYGTTLFGKLIRIYLNVMIFNFIGLEPSSCTSGILYRE